MRHHGARWSERAAGGVGQAQAHGRGAVGGSWRQVCLRESTKCSGDRRPCPSVSLAPRPGDEVDKSVRVGPHRFGRLTVAILPSPLPIPVLLLMPPISIRSHTRFVGAPGIPFGPSLKFHGQVRASDPSVPQPENVVSCLSRTVARASDTAIRPRKDQRPLGYAAAARLASAADAAQPPRCCLPSLRRAARYCARLARTSPPSARL